MIFKEIFSFNFLLLILVWIFGLIPVWAGVGLWFFLDPTGFWQKLSILIAYLFLFIIQIPLAMFIAFATNEFKKLLRKKNDS